MRRLVSAVCLVLALVVPVLVPASANAERHLAVSGRIEFNNNPPVLFPLTPIGGYLLKTDMLSGNITGDIESSQFVFIRTLVIHLNDDDVDVTGEITASATMFGRPGPGGFTQRITATASKSTGAIQGEWVLLNGTGTLAGLHGQGTFSGIAGQASDYSGRIYFDTN